MTKLLAFDPDKKKEVSCGDLADGVFTKKVSAKHFMRVVNGYGIQECVFAKLQAENVRMVAIKETHTGKVYEAALQVWLEHGRVMDYGSGGQRFLSLKYLDPHEHTAPIPTNNMELGI